MTRDEWERYEEIANLPNVKLAARARCAEQGHQWENCASVTMRVYRACKWCGDVR